MSVDKVQKRYLSKMFKIKIILYSTRIYFEIHYINISVDMDATIEYDAPDMLFDMEMLQTMTYQEFNERFKSEPTHEEIMEVNCATVLAKEIPNCTVSLHRLQCLDFICLRQPKVYMGRRLEDRVEQDEHVSSYRLAPRVVMRPTMDDSGTFLKKPTMPVSKSIQSEIESNLFTTPKNLKRFTCGDCNKKFKTAKTLYGHKRLAHTDNYKFKCNQCGRRFFNKYHHATHLRWHMRILNFQCNVCGQKFVRKALLTHHLVHEHAQNIKCSHCDQTFVSPKSYRCHLRLIGKEFICPICERKFHSFAGVSKHAKQCSKK